MGRSDRDGGDTAAGGGRHVSLARALLLCGALAAAGCEREAPPGPEADAGLAPLATPPVDPTGPDPEAPDDGLRTALHDVRDRFRCNRISGCAAHAALLRYGWKARPALERIFASAPRRASWRARVVRIVAELDDPEAAPMLRRALRDHSDEVRAYAIYGLGRLDDLTEAAEIRRFARADGPFSTATSRLTARFMLHARGERGMGQAFVRELGVRARQAMAATAVSWGLHLCTRRDAPDCTPVLAAAARHPAFIVRRAALDVIEAGPRPAHVPALLSLLADPVPSLGRRARAALVQIAGGGDGRTPRAWRDWWAARVERGGAAAGDALRAPSP